MTSLVEIDLLRGGQRLLRYLDLAEVVYHLACDYLMLINRQRHRLDDGMDYTLYPISLRDPSLACRYPWQMTTETSRLIYRS